VAQIMGHSVFNHLLAVMSPLVISMIILLEIPGAAVLAAIFLGEKLPGGTYAGLALILVGLAVVVRGQARTRPRGGSSPRTVEVPPALGGD
jgi:drug/metabolite transporter (DMT)-like permease